MPRNQSRCTKLVRHKYSTCATNINVIILTQYVFYLFNFELFYFIRQLCNIDFKNSTKLTAMESVTTYNEPITYVLQPLLAIRVMLNPSTETQVLVDKLKMIRQIKVSALISENNIIILINIFCD